MEVKINKGGVGFGFGDIIIWDKLLWELKVLAVLESCGGFTSHLFGNTFGQSFCILFQAKASQGEIAIAAFCTDSYALVDLFDVNTDEFGHLVCYRDTKSVKRNSAGLSAWHGRQRRQTTI